MFSQLRGDWNSDSFIRYSTSILKEVYSTSEVVMMSELLKLVASALLVLYDKAPTSSDGVGLSKLYWLAMNSSQIILLVVMYSIANLLAYASLSRIDAGVYTVLQQLKIFTTAGFSVLFLGTSISYTKVRGLVLLAIGCVLVASPAYNKPDSNCVTDTTAQAPVGNSSAYGYGILAVLVMVMISGASSVYLEKILKANDSRKLTIWERNFQLALYSMLLMLLIVYWELWAGSEGGSMVADMTPFQGWSIYTVGIVVLQASGGILVAATLKYADAILKNFATAGSIIMSGILGYIFMEGHIDIFMVLGAFCTILALFNYTLDTTPVLSCSSPTSASASKENLLRENAGKV